MDPQARPDERRNWAEALVRESLQVQSEPSKELVIALLSLSSNADVQRAVCDAIVLGKGAHQEEHDERFADPLMDLLNSPVPDLRAAAALALSELPGPRIPIRLAEIAAQPDAPLPRREAAVDALSPNVFRRDVVGQLVNLLDVPAPEIVGRVLSALEPAARTSPGRDPQAWRSWWAEQSKLSDEAWLTLQIRGNRDAARSVRTQFENHREKSRRQITDLASRLHDFQREVFRSLPADQRDARLVEWLNDPQDEVKMTAMAIIKGRIADEGKRPDGEMLANLLRSIKEGSPPVRREAVFIIQNLTDPAVVRAVLAALEEERDPATRAALFKAAAKLNATEAVGAMLREIAQSDAPVECIREAAVALGEIARHGGAGAKLSDAAATLTARYATVPASDTALRSSLLSAMAGIADRAFLPLFLEAVDTEHPQLIRPAVQGLLALGDSSKIARIRRYTAHPDPLVRLAALEAVGTLGREESDFEAVLARLNPGLESNELVREEAWRGFRNLLKGKPVRDRLQAASLLRDVPDREVEVLTELEVELAATKNAASELDTVRDRLSDVLLTQGRFADAVPYLRALVVARTQLGNPARLDAGLRLLDAALRAQVENIADLVKELAGAVGTDEYAATRIVDTVAQFLEAPEIVADSARSRAVLSELQTVPPELLGSRWPELLSRIAARLQASNGTHP